MLLGVYSSWKKDLWLMVRWLIRVLDIWCSGLRKLNGVKQTLISLVDMLLLVYTFLLRGYWFARVRMVFFMLLAWEEIEESFTSTDWRYWLYVLIRIGWELIIGFCWIWVEKFEAWSLLVVSFNHWGLKFKLLEIYHGTGVQEVTLLLVWSYCYYMYSYCQFVS